MNKSLMEQHTKKLVNHMNDYQQAAQLQQKGEAALFNRHRLPGGGFTSGLKEDLAKYRKDFADEWGAEGWRNEQFVKQQIEDTQNQAQAKTQESVAQREEFLNNLHKTRKQQPEQVQKPR
jgi:hypothetical protein